MADPAPETTTKEPTAPVSDKSHDVKESDTQGGDGGAEGDGGDRRGGKQAWKRGGGGRFRGGRGRWRDQPYGPHDYEKRGGGSWRRGPNRRDQQADIRAEELQAASLAQKDDKVISFDCRLRPKSELTGWLRYYKPSELKRSQKIGYIAVLTKNVSSVVEEKFCFGTDDIASKNQDLISDWEYLTSDPTSKIDYSTLRALAKKHDICGGKWLFNVKRHDVDATWMYLCSALVSEEEPMPCLAAKITPVNDEPAAGGGGRGQGHMVTVYTKDFTDEDNVFQVEKILRKVPIKLQLTYKPDLFSALGIYRNNKYKLRPVIYSSQWHHMSSKSEIESVFDMNWSYVGGTGDLREQQPPPVKKEDLEAIIDLSLEQLGAQLAEFDLNSEAAADRGKEAPGGDAKDTKDEGEEKGSGDVTVPAVAFCDVTVPPPPAFCDVTVPPPKLADKNEDGDKSITNEGTLANTKSADIQDIKNKKDLMKAESDDVSGKEKEDQEPLKVLDDQVVVSSELTDQAKAEPTAEAVGIPPTESGKPVKVSVPLDEAIKMCMDNLLETKEKEGKSEDADKTTTTAAPAAEKKATDIATTNDNDTQIEKPKPAGKEAGEVALDVRAATGPSGDQAVATGDDGSSSSSDLDPDSDADTITETGEESDSREKSCVITDGEEEAGSVESSCSDTADGDGGGSGADRNNNPLADVVVAAGAADVTEENRREADDAK